MASAMTKDMNQTKMKQRKKHFKKQKQKLFRANEPFISVFMWGVNHTVKELTHMKMPLMLMPDDFKSYSKVKIDNHIFNKENLPSHFKVKEYCPVVFRRLREIFKIDDKEYTNSICVTQPIRVEDRGRSVARFLHSYDHKFVIKTLTSEDIAEMHGFLPKYHQYLVENKCETLLPQYLGMYRLTLNGGEHYLMVMRNVFSATFKAHKKYDLKGSTVQREASDKEKKKVFPTFKDNDFVKDNMKIYLDTEHRESFLAKLKTDVEFLASLKLMDYSLLVGVHDCDRADKYTDELQDGDGNGFLDGSPGEEEIGRCDHAAVSSTTPPDSPRGGVNPLRQDSISGEEGIADSFYAIRSSSKSQKNEVYYMGLIDILTHYDTKKKAAHAMKTAKHGAGAEISTIQPAQYSKRFSEFIGEQLVAL
uniref:1-phosphatidylinositol-5-phosphate 4-kinase n=1 Tax=Phallusia mammillata TaxID=59560 RepID=A0A6F9DPC9_9ASCI|nr:phosphatidylinositol 5-phosphate 4-kinase type-2 alpha [Phallusia mammillata]